MMPDSTQYRVEPGDFGGWIIYDEQGRERARVVEYADAILFAAAPAMIEALEMGTELTEGAALLKKAADVIGRDSPTYYWLADCLRTKANAEQAAIDVAKGEKT